MIILHPEQTNSVKWMKEMTIILSQYNSQKVGNTSLLELFMDKHIFMMFGLRKRLRFLEKNRNLVRLDVLPGKMIGF